MDLAAAGFNAPSGEGEAKTQAGSIGSALLERTEQFVDVPARQTAAFVLDLDVHAVEVGDDPQRDGRVRLRELEGVLQHVFHRRCEDSSFSLDRHSSVNGQNDQCDLSRARLLRGTRRYLRNEL